MIHTRLARASLSDQPLAPVAAYELLDGIQQCLAKNVNFMLRSLGIRVCSVAAGPVEQLLPDGGIESNSPDRRPSYVTKFFPPVKMSSHLNLIRGNIFRRLRLITRGLLSNATVRSDQLCEALQHIILAK